MKREPNKLAMTLTVLMLGCGIAHAAVSPHEEGCS